MSIESGVFQQLHPLLEKFVFERPISINSLLVEKFDKKRSKWRKKPCYLINGHFP